MPKSQFIDPKELLKKGKITFEDIPVNAYQKTMAMERNNFSDTQLLEIYTQMKIIREFESAIGNIKNKEGYHGIEHIYNGPAHLAIGQEGGAVGQAFVLNEDDIIFGSHRGHAELLARGLNAINMFSPQKLMDIMESYDDGHILRVIEKYHQGSDIKELAREFLLYGALSEVFAKSTGFQKGMSGSMHLFFMPFGVYPNNAIVGGSAPIATGAALYKKIQGKKGIVVSNTGDGALGCGVVYESMNFAAMDQYKMLWEKEGGLPIIFAISDNGYGMGGQTRGETMGYDLLARLGAGISPSQMYAERINGNNPLAVIDAYKRKKEILERGEGPVLLDVVTYRLEGHSQSDPSSYRDDSEIKAWEKCDPLTTYPSELIKSGVCSQYDIEGQNEKIIDRMIKICRLVADDKISPYYDFSKDKLFLENVMFSGGRVEKMGKDTPKTLMPKEKNSRVKEISKLSRKGIDEKGLPLEKGFLTLRDALFEAIIDKFYDDSSLVAYGEEVRDWGGKCGVYRGLTEALPYPRLFNSPISEAAIVSTAIGYAMSGGRVVIEIMFADFMARAGDEIFNQLAKWQAMSVGALKLPVVLRVSIGSKYGAQHSQDWTALTAHIPGLKVVYPATPYDAKGLMNTALNSTDPIIFFESQALYDKGELFENEGVPKGSYEIEFGVPSIKRKGSHLTILTIGSALYTAMDTARELSQKYGIEAEVIDARSIVPFDYNKVVESVKKTGKILLVSEAVERGSILKDFSSNITRLCFNYLSKPPIVMGARNWITPPYEFENIYYPTPSSMLDAIHNNLIPLSGYTPSQKEDERELIRRAKLGV